MKSVLLLLSMFLMLATIFFVGACGSSSSNVGAQEIEGCKLAPGKEIIDKESLLGTPPAWINSLPKRGKIDEEKVIFFYGTAVHPVENVAVDNARAVASGEAAETIKQNVIKEYAKAYESVGGPGKESYEEIQKGLLATKSKVQLQGAETTGEYKAKVLRVWKVNQEECKITKSDMATKVWVQKALPYDKYLALRDDIVQKAPVNEQQKKLLAEADKKIEELDQLDQLDKSYTEEEIPAQKEVPADAELPPPTTGEGDTKAPAGDPAVDASGKKIEREIVE